MAFDIRRATFLSRAASQWKEATNKFGTSTCPKIAADRKVCEPGFYSYAEPLSDAKKSHNNFKFKRRITIAVAQAAISTTGD